MWTSLRFRDWPIRTKFVLPMIVMLTALLLSTYLYLPGHLKKVLYATYRQEAVKTAELFSVAVSHALNQHSFELLQKTLQSAKVDHHIAFIFLFDEHGEEYASYNPQHVLFTSRWLAQPEVAENEQGFIVLNESIQYQNEQRLGGLLLGFSLQELHEQVSRVYLITALFSIGSFVVGLMLINFISRYVTTPLSLLQRQMHEIVTSGSFGTDVPVESSDEVGRLAADFNRMMALLRSRHKRLVQSQKRYRSLYQKHQKLNQLKSIFVSDASHHLRTPLTIMRGEIEVALRRERQPADYRETLSIVEEEAAHLGKIVESLLTLAKADSGKLLAMQEDIDFSAVCRQQAKLARLLAEEKGVCLKHAIERRCLMRGDPNRLGELVLNLLENAIKYTPKGGVVELNLEKRDESVVLEVRDSGVGIPAADLENVFERFYRGRNAMRLSKGSGLGLSICKSIAEAHGGEISVSSAVGKGSTFRVVFKKGEEAS